jgi:hypothetical protein
MQCSYCDTQTVYPTRCAIPTCLNVQCGCTVWFQCKGKCKSVVCESCCVKYQCCCRSNAGAPTTYDEVKNVFTHAVYFKQDQITWNRTFETVACMFCTNHPQISQAYKSYKSCCFVCPECFHHSQLPMKCCDGQTTIFKKRADVGYFLRPMPPLDMQYFFNKPKQETVIIASCTSGCNNNAKTLCKKCMRCLKPFCSSLMCGCSTSYGFECHPCSRKETKTNEGSTATSTSSTRGILRLQKQHPICCSFCLGPDALRCHSCNQNNICKRCASTFPQYEESDVCRVCYLKQLAPLKLERSSRFQPKKKMCSSCAKHEAFHECTMCFYFMCVTCMAFCSECRRPFDICVACAKATKPICACTEQQPRCSSCSFLCELFPCVSCGQHFCNICMVTCDKCNASTKLCNNCDLQYPQYKCNCSSPASSYASPASNSYASPPATSNSSKKAVEKCH